MKTIVIAAGYATRLYPLTENFPKPLLQIGSSTILGRMLDDIDTIPEIDEHIIVTNGKFASIFEDWAGKRCGSRASSGKSSASLHPSHSLSLRACGPLPFKRPRAATDFPEDAPKRQGAVKPITVLSDGTFTNETRLGAVCDLLFAIETLKIDDDLLVVAADNILEFSFRGFVEYAKEKGTSCIMCHYEPEIYKLQRTGVIEVDKDMKVLQMQEKPQEPVSHWAVPPFYVYLRKDLDLVRHSVENGCGKDAPGNLAHYMAEHTILHAWPMPGARFDIGSLDTYEEAKLKYID